MLCTFNLNPHVCEYTHLTRHVIANIIQSVACVFILLIVVFTEQKFHFQVQAISTL